MRTVAIHILCLLLCIPSLSSNAQSADNCIPVYSRRGADAAYLPGEKLYFSINYKFGFINAEVGTASVILDTVRTSEKACFHCSVSGKTAKAFDRFFMVREAFDSWFTYEQLQPVHFTRETHEGHYTSTNSYNYLWNGQNPVIDADVFTSNWNETRHFELPLKECTFDLPSLFYFARNINVSKLKLNVKYPMTFAIDDAVYDVYFIYKGKTNKKVKGLGTVRCMHFGAKLIEGEVFNGDSDMDIYFSDDGNRLPVCFGADVVVGHVEGRLTSSSGLKYPFSSMLK